MMVWVKRALTVFLVGSAIFAALNLMLTPAWHDGSQEYPIWRIFNWFMAPGAIIALVTAFLWKRERTSHVSDYHGALRYVEANAAFYGAVALTMLFFWEWIWTLNPESETGLAVTSHMVYFPIMDTIYTIVCLMTGQHLWRSAAGQD